MISRNEEISKITSDTTAAVYLQDLSRNVIFIASITYKNGDKKTISVNCEISKTLSLKEIEKASTIAQENMMKVLEEEDGSKIEFIFFSPIISSEISNKYNGKDLDLALSPLNHDAICNKIAPVFKDNCPYQICALAIFVEKEEYTTPLFMLPQYSLDNVNQKQSGTHLSGHKK